MDRERPDGSGEGFREDEEKSVKRAVHTGQGSDQKQEVPSVRKEGEQSKQTLTSNDRG